MSNCGPLGWASSASGYRYAALDPISGQPWPAIPSCCLALAQRAAALAGYVNFQPDACLVNQYLPGAKLSLHQDRDEQDLSAPIVSLSLGLPAHQPDVSPGQVPFLNVKLASSPCKSSADSFKKKSTYPNQSNQ